MLNLNNKKVCIFVDGENLRHSINDLFPQFDKRGYLPKTDWAKFFDWIASEVAGADADRIRTYWYVVENIDFIPYNLNSAKKDKATLIRVLSRDSNNAKALRECSGTKQDQLIEKMCNELETRQKDMESRFSGWISIQSGIEAKCKAVEFRRAGSIKYNLYEKNFGSEKAVDVKLATDLIRLKDIYDVAVIISGDQDYVPAVDAIKDLGKRTVNVSFLKADGYLLPIGAKRLNQATDWNIEVKHSDLKNYLGL